jgi:NTF2-related export protein 1/2
MAASHTLSDTDRTRVSTEVAETFTDAYYTILNSISSRDMIKDFYIPNNPGSTPNRTLPMINYNGDLSNDGLTFQTKFQEMPFTFYEVQSLNAHVLNPCLDPNGAKTRKEAERNLSLAVHVSGYVRLNERKDGPLRGFSEEFVLMPNKGELGGKGTAKSGEGRQWLIQVQNFRFTT